ncbi:phosphate ABC transporter substrate-binding protein PstS [Acidomonas methanolica]|uniref:Phosphate-binding protein PstS n=1 Tax=Acidomonas methanolica NBRC 104435 TaxID=1231351 RepID=A0A023D1X7_ACIMT|nr:phosphate ABC transporter substrate-binding protein PstS [Acidomonas methanolica]MBU2654557.1 phosphate ABC transporter substrate-binding protein PstS [Acidomonas methanolica]TCS27430.1 phosphate ABC transporter substrate-binding protein (PhoT family) [Acidomonas methanolica]GAJ28089.1 ABC transporter phosphate permease [Acidomonas methanolica NBRC 104435]GBQ49403.1 phosphate-binding periplasmic protein [Acidomonas methanolica]GEK98663.1 phosphate-binding protein PstS [Acidomonas methanolic
MRLSRVLALTTCALTALAGASSAQAASITGAGSSFAAPLYDAWAASVKKAGGPEVNYQSVGSGAGQNQIIARTVDFGASDAPVAGAKLAANKLYQFPTAMGGIVVIVNIPGVKSGVLKLNGATLAGLYDGSITEWDDPRIEALNPGLKLPDSDVAPVHRADASGTTFVFTSYLSKVSPNWKQKFGASTSISWAGGAGARGNDGVAASVKATEGGIGYVEYAYANRNHLTVTELEDHDGEYVKPDIGSFTAAAKGADWAHADHYAVDLLDGPGKGAWPIVAATFVLVPTNPTNATQARAVKDFFTFGLEKGDSDALALDYVMLPASVKSEILAGWPK